MGKHRNATKVDGSMPKDASPTPSSHGGELCDAAQILMEEAASQTGASSKIPFGFKWWRRSPSNHSLLLEHWWAHSTTPDDWMHYCVHIRVTLGEGSDDQPPPSLPQVEWIADCQYIARSLSWGLNHWRCGHCTGGGSPILWKVLTQGGDSW